MRLWVKSCLIGLALVFVPAAITVGPVAWQIVIAGRESNCIAVVDHLEREIGNFRRHAGRLPGGLEELSISPKLMERFDPRYAVSDDGSNFVVFVEAPSSDADVIFRLVPDERVPRLDTAKAAPFIELVRAAGIDLREEDLVED